MKNAQRESVTDVALPPLSMRWMVGKVGKVCCGGDSLIGRDGKERSLRDLS